MTEYIQSPLFGAVPRGSLKRPADFDRSLLALALTAEQRWQIGFHLEQGQPFRLTFRPVPEYRDRYTSIVVSFDGADLVDVTPVHRKGGKS